jgi:glycosyltransferase involved in cell wall biosynthesis
MNKIAYLLHRFPRVSDTFIMRELRALRRTGLDVQVMSVWKPDANQTSPDLLAEWETTRFLVSQPLRSVAAGLCLGILCFPVRFLATVALALKTRRPGLRGLTFQFLYLAEAVLAAQVIRQRKIVHLHNHFGDHSGIITILAARLAGIGYSISFHGPHVFYDGASEHIKEKVAFASFIRCISYFCRSQVILFSGETDVRSIKVIHCGIEPDDYQFRPPRPRVANILCAARLAPEKGLEFLLRALRTLGDKGQNIELRLIGDGPSLPALQGLARCLNIIDRVHFLGSMGESGVLGELQTADLFVLPSLAEGLPTSLMEAMAAGVPVIATNVAATSELVEHEKTGLLVRPSDADALSTAIIRMIDDYPLRLRVAELGRKKVVEEFDINKEVAVLCHCLLDASFADMRLFRSNLQQR